MKDFKDKKLGDDQLEEVTGGVIFNASGIIGSDPNMPWEVLDNRNGNVNDNGNDNGVGKKHCTDGPPASECAPHNQEEQ